MTDFEQQSLERYLLKFGHNMTKICKYLDKSFVIHYLSLLSFLGLCVNNFHKGNILEQVC